MADQVFRHQHRVTYAECTAGNHVYYARYLDILEAARGEFFRSLGIPLAALQEAGTIFPVVECAIKYLAPARYDDVLTIELWVASASRLRLDFACRVLDADGTPLVEATTRHVCTDPQEKPKRMPAEVFAKLQPSPGARVCDPQHVHSESTS